MANAGKFTMELRGPYPVQLVLTREGDDGAIRFYHQELSDLKYTVDKAMQEARHKLGKDADEV